MASLERLPWSERTRELNAEGYAVLPSVLEGSLVRRWASELAPPPSRSAQLALTSGHVQHVDLRVLEEHELPGPLCDLREDLYRRVVDLANAWNERRGEGYRFPSTWRAFHEQNLRAGLRRSLSCVERLVAPDFSPLRQSDEGQHVFPMQMVTLLSEPDVDFVGGELVLTEQRPRMQSRPIVVPLTLGDVALIATARRPVQGSQGFYTVNTRHAVNRVHRGQRLALEVSFHQAPEP